MQNQRLERPADACLCIDALQQSPLCSKVAKFFIVKLRVPDEPVFHPLHELLLVLC
jgi:hypothetical protein